MAVSFLELVIGSKDAKCITKFRDDRKTIFKTVLFCFKKMKVSGRSKQLFEKRIETLSKTKP